MPNELMMNQFTNEFGAGGAATTQMGVLNN